MKLKLVKLSKKYERQFNEMMTEWSNNKGQYANPGNLWKVDWHLFNTFIIELERNKSDEIKSANSFYFALDEETDEFVGAVDIRHDLVKGNCHQGGHIADGIRPSKRRMGYGTQMLKLTLDKCKEMGMNKVLITADKKNIPSIKLIEKCGGVKEDVPAYSREEEQRFWVTLNEETIETERLVINREMPSDYIDAFRWAGDKRVTKYLLSSGVTKPEEMLNWLELNDPNNKKRLVMIARDKNDNRAIGSIGAFFIPKKDEWEFGYSVAYDEWNKGYATEMAKAMIEHLNKNYDAYRFKGECAKENLGSNAVLKKLGMKKVGEAEYTKNDGSSTYYSNVYSMEYEKY